MRRSTMRSEVVALLLCILVLPTKLIADCKKAQPEQTPHGANEPEILKERKVGLLRGIVFIGVGGPASDVVVEIYRYEGTADETTKFLNGATRIAACLTSENGCFEFPQLKSGRYLLRAGTVSSAGINEVHAIFKVTGTRKTHHIEIRLPVGT